MLVHDMRSPIQVLLAHLEILREDIRGASLVDVESAIDGANALNRMTSNVLDVSRLEAGRMPVRRIRTDIAALSASVVAAARVLQPTRDIAVETHGDPDCSCDPELTRRIIDNLVSNAMKHSELDGRVRVIVSGLDGTVRIAVTDEGAVVPPEKRARIFEHFSAESLQSASGYESSGLGLAFCRLAALAQGGSIRVENGTQRGNAFVVELPR